MSIDHRIPNPNKKLTEQLVTQFARQSAVKSADTQTETESSAESGDFLTIVRDRGDSYIVRITRTDQKTGARTEHTDTIPRELFEACVRTGYLTKVQHSPIHADCPAKRL